MSDETTHCDHIDNHPGLLEQCPVLVVRTRDRVLAVRLEEGEPVVVGRSPMANVPIDDPRLSRRHLRVVLEPDGRITIEDLRSTNGTLVDNQPLVGCRSLRPESSVRAGDVVIRVEGLDSWSAMQTGLACHEDFEKALREAVARHDQVGVVLARVPDGLPLSEWGRRLATAAGPDGTVALYAGRTLEVLLRGRSPARIRGRVGAISGLGALRCGVATWPVPISNPDAMVSAALTAMEKATPGGAPQEAAAEAGAEALAVDPLSRDLFETVARVAAARAPVLLQGETGTGKEVVARAVHERSGRGGPFLAINCGAIPANLLESELFGHVRGAFTGAEQSRRGVFREADGGTLFLDEIGELAAPAQVALLRVLETRRVTPVGSTGEVAVDVRVVAATHRDLRNMARAGTFRWDLLYRLEVLALEIPPLRRRPLDIEPLAEHFLALARNLHGVRVTGFSEGVRAALLSYAWPGNVRELRNVVERAAVMCRGDLVEQDDLPERLRYREAVATPERAELTEEVVLPLPGVTWTGHKDRLEAALIRRALDAAAHNQTEAARQLGLPRRTLVYKLGHLPMDRCTTEGDLLLSMLENRRDGDVPYRERLARLMDRLLERAATNEPDPETLAAALDLHPRTVRAKIKRSQW